MSSSGSVKNADLIFYLREPCVRSGVRAMAMGEAAASLAGAELAVVAGTLQY